MGERIVFGGQAPLSIDEWHQPGFEVWGPFGSDKPSAIWAALKRCCVPLQCFDGSLRPDVPAWAKPVMLSTRFAHFEDMILAGGESQPVRFTGFDRSGNARLTGF